MKMEDFVLTTAIIDVVPPVEKPDIIRRLLTRLAIDGHIEPANLESILDALIARESISSSGIGRGIAVPHTRTPHVSRPLAMVAVCRPPVAFESIDCELTDIFLLGLLPFDQTHVQDRELTQLSQTLLKKLADATFRDQLRKATSSAELKEWLYEVA